MKKINTAGLIVGMTCLLLIQACTRKAVERKDNQLFTALDPEKTGITFINQVTDTKDFNIFTYRNFYNGGGVAIGDINNDGLADLYFTANTSGNKLYLNKGNWEFADITETAEVRGSKSWSTGVTMADVNADGLLDIYVCNSGDVKGDNKENELFINQGNLTFKENAKDFGLNNGGYSTHASFFDYDLDGDLDCYLLNNSFKSIERVEQFMVSREVRDAEGGDKLLQNDGGKFINVSAQAGIYESAIGFGLGVSVSDLNGDMLPDIYISNDFWERDYLYFNKGNGTFSEEIVNSTSVISASSMGADVADLNNDGSAEIFTTEMLPGDNNRLKTMARFEETNIKELRVRSSYHYQLMQNCLHVNNGKGNFQEMAFLAGTATTDWSWGALMFDMDNDGWKDIFISNGIFRDITSMDFADFVGDKENIKRIVQEKGKFDFNDLMDQIPSQKLANYAFINQRALDFENRAEQLGLGEPSFSNGAAYGDLDNDGDMDLVVNNLNMQAFIYRNNAELKKNRFLKIKFKGPEKNSFGIGAHVTLYIKGEQQVLQNFNTRGFESSIEPNLLFGLEGETIVDSIVAVWPDHKRHVLKGIKSDQVLTLDYGAADSVFKLNGEVVSPLYRDVTKNVLHGNIFHKENSFNDFDVERLLPRKISTEGPKILKGDLNNDKLDDFILLGAFGDPDKLFLQRNNGEFYQHQVPALLADSLVESTCGTLLDVDKDGDLDVLIGSGGNEFDRGVMVHMLRLYQNDGNGNLKRTLDNVPKAIGNFSCIVAEDFDQDGDEDLFIGGRVVPGSYGLRPRSFLFRRDSDGSWANITPEKLAGAGMVTDAVWSDVDNDSRKDLIVVGEWMPVLIFTNNGAQLSAANPIANSHGWWNTIEKGDLNNDGREDFVLGNWGRNSKFQASTSRPLTMFVKDFDKNGKSEFIINWYPPLEKAPYPFASKMDITGQLPLLKKNSLKYASYAAKSYEQLLSDDQRKGADFYTATNLQSAILWNKGNYKLDLEPLPVEAQVSPIFTIVIDDLDGDSMTDLFLGGNFYGLKPEVGRQNSNFGLILKGNDSGKFTPMLPGMTGVDIEGEVRDAKILVGTKKSKMILIGRNNAPALLFKKN